MCTNGNGNNLKKRKSGIACNTSRCTSVGFDEDAASYVGAVNGFCTIRRELEIEVVVNLRS